MAEAVVASIMIPKSGKSKAKTFEKKRITPVPYTFEYEAYPETDEGIALAKSQPKVWLTDMQILKTINATELANAKAAALAKALFSKGHVKATLETSPQMQLRNVYKTLLAGKNADGTPKHTEESAKAAASAFLGIDWEDDDVE